MTKYISGVVKLNESLEQIEFASANIRLSLMQEAISGVVTSKGFWDTKIVNDSISIYDPEANAKCHFGMLVGYFDEVWWFGIVLFNTSDLKASTADKLQKVSDILVQSGVKYPYKAITMYMLIPLGLSRARILASLCQKCLTQLMIMICYYIKSMRFCIKS